jgi:hypothetical protein
MMVVRCDITISEHVICSKVPIRCIASGKRNYHMMEALDGAIDSMKASRRSTTVSAALLSPYIKTVLTTSIF